MRYELRSHRREASGVGNLHLSSHVTLILIESITSLNAITTVYSRRVADRYTYFVVGALWGWDVWVHTARYNVSAGTRSYDFVVDRLGRTKRTEGPLGNLSDGRILKVHNPNAQRGLSRGQRNHDAGHSFGKQFGGPGEFPNVVLMRRTWNRTGGVAIRWSRNRTN